MGYVRAELRIFIYLGNWIMDTQRQDPWAIPQRSVMRGVRKPLDPRLGVGAHLRSQMGKGLIDLPKLHNSFNSGERATGNTLKSLNEMLETSGVNCQLRKSYYQECLFYYVDSPELRSKPSIGRAVGYRINDHTEQAWLKIIRRKLRLLEQ